VNCLGGHVVSLCWELIGNEAVGNFSKDIRYEILRVSVREKRPVPQTDARHYRRVKLTVAFCNVPRIRLRQVQILIFRYPLFTLSLLVLSPSPLFCKSYQFVANPSSFLRNRLGRLKWAASLPLCVYGS
jgi:hypothetical protein